MGRRRVKKVTLGTQSILKPSGIAEDYARDLSRRWIKGFFKNGENTYKLHSFLLEHQPALIIAATDHISARMLRRLPDWMPIGGLFTFFKTPRFLFDKGNQSSEINRLAKTFVIGDVRASCLEGLVGGDLLLRLGGGN